MLENLALAVSALCTFYGAARLYYATNSPDSSGTIRLLGGAAALVAGLITATLVLRSKIHWRRIQKQNRERT
jgi:hypothetical protein